MRTFKAFNTPEIFITGTAESDIGCSKNGLVDLKDDLNDFCRIINYVRQDKRWIAVINPSSLLKKMLNTVELDTKQILMVYTNDKFKSLKTICRALSCGNCAAVIGKLDDLSATDYQMLFDSCISGNSIAYLISKSKDSALSGSHSLVNDTNELYLCSDTYGINNNPLNHEESNSISSSKQSKNVIDFKVKKEELQSSFEF